MHVNFIKRCNGFTLIELVVGIVVMSVALVMIASVIMPQLKRGIDPVWQVRSVTLAQSLLNEISAKAFDENAISSAGRIACNSDLDCSTAANLGSELDEDRSLFDDIDDYNNLTLFGADIINANDEVLSNDITQLFSGFSAQVQVFYDDNADGINDADPDNDGVIDTPNLVGNQKIISITIVTPDGENLSFASYRTNI